MAEGHGSINGGTTEGKILAPSYFLNLKNISLMFNARQEKEIFLLKSIQTCSAAHPVSYSVCYQGLFPY
jgi:hypothetical protein